MVAFGLYVSVRSRKDDSPALQAYWTNMTNLWLGRNSVGVFLVIFNIWFWFWLFSWMFPVLLRFEHLLARYVK